MNGAPSFKVTQAGIESRLNFSEFLRRFSELYCTFPEPFQRSCNPSNTNFCLAFAIRLNESPMSQERLNDSKRAKINWKRLSVDLREGESKKLKAVKRDGVLARPYNFKVP